MINIRLARPADASHIRDVHVASVHTLCAKDYTPEQLTAWTDREPEAYRTRMDQPDGAFLVAEWGKKIVGFSSLLGEEVLSLYVHPDHAGRGVGGALMDAIEEAARKKGVVVLRLNSSLTAVPFYEKRGYRNVRPSLFHLPNGVDIPCFAMTKRLDI